MQRLLTALLTWIAVGLTGCTTVTPSTATHADYSIEQTDTLPQVIHLSGGTDSH